MVPSDKVETVTSNVLLSVAYLPLGMVCVEIDHLSSSPVFGGVRVAHLFNFVCYRIMCLCILSSVL